MGSVSQAVADHHIGISGLANEVSKLPNQQITTDGVENLMEKVNVLDQVTKSRFGAGFLSNEGPALYSLVKNNGSMIKASTANCSYSERTAFNVIRKLEDAGLVSKYNNSDDFRRLEMNFKFDDIVKLLNKAV
jgi:hypothetical protein